MQSEPLALLRTHLNRCVALASQINFLLALQERIRAEKPEARVREGMSKSAKHQTSLRVAWAAVLAFWLVFPCIFQGNAAFVPHFELVSRSSSYWS